MSARSHCSGGGAPPGGRSPDAPQLSDCRVLLRETVRAECAIPSASEIGCRSRAAPRSRTRDSVAQKVCDANGVVQFKFPANGDFHTFAVERARASNGRREFIVYQRYEGTYTLSHFLNQTPVWEDDTLHKIYEQRWSAMPATTKKLYKNDFKAWGSKILAPKMDRIEVAMKWTGSGQHHSYDDLYNLVLFPLDLMHGEDHQEGDQEGEVLVGRRPEMVARRMSPRAGM